MFASNEHTHEQLAAERQKNIELNTKIKELTYQHAVETNTLNNQINDLKMQVYTLNSTIQQQDMHIIKIQSEYDCANDLLTVCKKEHQQYNKLLQDNTDTNAQLKHAH